MASNNEGDFWGKGSGNGGSGAQPPNEGDAGFWSKPGKAPKEPAPVVPAAPEPAAGGDEFWNKAEQKRKADVAAAARPVEEVQKSRKRRRRKIILISVGSVLLLLLILVALAPTIAGWLAPGIIEGNVAKQIAGKVKVDGASFSWFGPQKVKTITLSDREGKQVATFGVEDSAGLSGLMFGNLDLGTVTLSGVKADIIKYSDGTTNLEQAIAPKKSAAPAKGGAVASGKKGGSDEPSIPDSLKAKVVGHKMQVSFIDQSRAGSPTVTLKNIELEASIGAGQATSLSLGADAMSGAQTGSISVTAKAEKLIRKDGVIQPGKAAVDVDVAVRGLPLELADAFATLPPGTSVRRAIGETVELTFKAKGSLNDATASLSVIATNFTAKGDVKVANSVVTSESPLEVTLKGAAIKEFAPKADASGGATVDAYPDVKVSVQNLHVQIPGDAGPDLRNAGATVLLGLSETRGSVAVDNRTQAFKIAALEARIEASDLAKGAHVTAATKATINDQPAGDVNVDVTVAGLLDKSGAPVKGPPGTVQGTVAIKKIATAIAQPFLGAIKIDLAKDIGPTLDIEAKASTDLASAGAGGTPPTSVSLSVLSDGVKVGGKLLMSQSELRTVDEGFKVEVLGAAGIASRFVDPSTGWAVSPGPTRGGAVLTLKNLVVPRDAAGAPQLDKAAGHVDVSMGAMTVSQTMGAAGDAINVGSVTLGADLAAGGKGKVTLASEMAFAGSPFRAVGTFDISNLIAPAAAGKSAAMTPPQQLRPQGYLQLKDVPTGLARLFVKPSTGADGKQMDLAKLIGDTLGPSVTVGVTTKGVPNAPENLGASVVVQTATTNVEAEAVLGTAEVALSKFVVKASVTPQTVSGLMSAFAPTVTGVPTLAGPSRVIVEAEPVRIPLKDFKPELALMGAAGVKVSIPGRTMVDGLTVANADGTKRSLGRVGVDSLEVSVKVPVGAMMAAALPDNRQMTATVSGKVLGADGVLAELSGRLSTQVSNGQLAGPLAANFKIERIDTGMVERLAGKDGMISGALGPTLTANLTASVTPPAGSNGKTFDFDKGLTNVELALDAPRLRSDGPITLTKTAAGVTLVKPVRLMMEVEPAYANKFLEPVKDPAQPDVVKKAAIQLTRPASLTVSLDRFVYPMGDAPGTLFDAGIGVVISELRMVTEDNQAVRMAQVSVQVNLKPVAGSDPTNSVPVEFSLAVAEATMGDQPAAKGMGLRGTVSDLVDGRGKVSMSAASVTMNGDLPVIPTPLIDALAKQNGLLVDALGPMASVKILVERFPLADVAEVKKGGQPPILSIQAESQRAKADIRGTIQGGVFVSEKPVDVTVLELSQELSKRLIKGLPLMGTLEKSPKDAPAVIEGVGVTAPLGNDMSKLNGEFHIDPGEAKFTTSDVFGSLLRKVNQQDTGSIGKKLQPLIIHVKQGVGTYEKWTVPLGSFEIQTEGTVDLVQRTIDVVTYVPFGQLSEGAAGSLVSGLGGVGASVINAVEVVPIRTKGSLDHPTTSIDAKAFAANLVKSLKPEDLIKRGLGDLLKKQLTPK